MRYLENNIINKCYNIPGLILSLKTQNKYKILYRLEKFLKSLSDKDANDLVTDTLIKIAESSGNSSIIICTKYALKLFGKYDDKAYASNLKINKYNNPFMIKIIHASGSDKIIMFERVISPTSHKKGLLITDKKEFIKLLTDGLNGLAFLNKKKIYHSDASLYNIGKSLISGNYVWLDFDDVLFDQDNSGNDINIEHLYKDFKYLIDNIISEFKNDSNHPLNNFFQNFYNQMKTNFIIEKEITIRTFRGVKKVTQYKFQFKVNDMLDFLNFFL